MPSRRTRSTATLARKSTELAFAAPQVVAHRVTRILAAGPHPSARDRREFQRMGSEKLSAFGEAWSAMTLQAMRAHQAFATALFRAWWSPWALAAPWQAATALQGAMLGVLNKGIAPVHRKATANARRLGHGAGRRAR